MAFRDLQAADQKKGYRRLIERALHLQIPGTDSASFLRESLRGNLVCPPRVNFLATAKGK